MLPYRKYQDSRISRFDILINDSYSDQLSTVRALCGLLVHPGMIIPSVRGVIPALGVGGGGGVWQYFYNLNLYLNYLLHKRTHLISFITTRNKLNTYYIKRRKPAEVTIILVS
jgi:hypothetical protein